MKEREAMELGFEYTGASCDSYDREKWEKYKKEAQEIKKTYKGADFRIVESRERTRWGSTVYKSIYGNKIYREAQYFNPELELDIIENRIPNRIEQIKAEAEKKIQEELEEQKQRKERYEYLMSLRKNN